MTMPNGNGLKDPLVTQRKMDVWKRIQLENPSLKAFGDKFYFIIGCISYIKKIIATNINSIVICSISTSHSN